MAISTYAELVTAVENWINRDDLAARVPEFIALAEAKFNRTIWTPQSEYTASADLEDRLCLPSDCRAVRSIYIENALTEVSPHDLRTLYTYAGTPTVYAIIDEQIHFGPQSSEAATVYINYYRSIPALQTYLTNWLLTANPDIYLYATLLQAEAFGWNDERLGLWKGALDEALAELEAAGNRRRWGGGPLIRKGFAFS